MADYPYTIPPGYVEGPSGSRTEPDGSVYTFANPPTLPASPPPVPTYELNIAAANDILRSEKADEALKRIQAAQYFLGSQMLKKALDSGNAKDAMQATMLMFPRNPSAAVGVLKGLTPPPQYDFTAATSNSPAFFNPRGGGKPVVVPQAALPPDLTLRKPEVTETSEGKVVQVPGSKSWRLVPNPTPPTITEHTRDLGPNPEAATNSAAPPRIMLTNRTIKATSPQAVAAPVVATAMAAPPGTKEGQRVRNKTTGKFGTVKNGIVVPDPDTTQ